MGFLWEDSTGARAVMFLREREAELRLQGRQGFIIDTIEFAEALDVKPGALHQLLANAVKLRYIKKVHGLGACVGWKLGPGGDSATIERRKVHPPLTPDELARRREANARRRQRADAAHSSAAPPPAGPVIAWPPGFVSAWPSTSDGYRPPPIAIDELEDEDAGEPPPLPTWLRGLVATPAPIEVEEPPEPQPQQLPLFDPAEIGPGGRARWRNLDLSLPPPRPARAAPRWRQTTFLEV